MQRASVAGRWSACLAASVLAAASARADLATNNLSNAARDAIRRDLMDFTAAGMDRRLGPNYAAYHGNVVEAFPNVYLAPTKQDAIGRPYQIGGPWSTTSGDYSSTQGQVLYAPDAGNFGVDRVTILEMSNYCYSEKPMPPWWGGFRPEPAVQKWQAAAPSPGMPVAMARGMGSWANCGVIVFSSGLIGTAGTCTANGTWPTLQLPPGKIPTAVCVTTKNEFALVTVCDVKSRKGQVAVIALQGGNEPTFNQDWQARYPGAPSVAWLSDMKLLGYVDLPGIEFPTALTAVGNHEGIRLNGANGNVTILSAFDLSQQASRDSFNTGVNADYASTAGFAVVIARQENKAAFIDLQPLFQRVHEQYFTSQDNFNYTRNLGPGPTQWPPTFTADPIWKPTVVKVMNVTTPTAVIATMSGGANARAYIASIDGTVRVYQLGGLSTESPALAAQITLASQTQVGRNPTCLAYQKLSPDTMIAVSRGDREIAWIKTDSTGSRVIRRLRDARLADPVFAEMADTHGTDTSLITVADFAGRKVINYRWTPIIYWSNGGTSFGVGPTGTNDFECGGWLDMPGSPFSVSAANVN